VERGRATRAHVIGWRRACSPPRLRRHLDRRRCKPNRASARLALPPLPGQGGAVPGGPGGGRGRDHPQGEDAPRDRPNPVALLRIGGHLVDQERRRPGRPQIMLIDGPAVLGWDRWRASTSRAPGADQDCWRTPAGTGRIEHRHVRRVCAHRAGRGQRGGHDGRASGQPGRGARRRRERVPPSSWTALLGEAVRSGTVQGRIPHPGAQAFSRPVRPSPWTGDAHGAPGAGDPGPAQRQHIDGALMSLLHLDGALMSL